MHASNETCQGYEDPESFVQPYHWWSHPKDQLSLHWDSYDIPVEGIPVVDVREAVKTDAGYSWVFKGPLLDVDLADNEIDRLDGVSVSQYVQGWREHGARIGRFFVVDGKGVIEWAD